MIILLILNILAMIQLLKVGSDWWLLPYGCSVLMLYPIIRGFVEGWSGEGKNEKNTQ